MPSIRFVTQKPPTTFSAPKNTATKPPALMMGLLLAASVIMPPTRMTPWIAFVALMSGVCSRFGTREINSHPRKAATTKIASCASNSCTLTGLAVCGVAGLRPALRSLQRLAGRRLADLAFVRYAGPVHDLVLEVELEMEILLDRKSTRLNSSHA